MMSQSNIVEIVIQADHKSVLKGVTHAEWEQFLKFELTETGKPPICGRLVGKGMTGKYMEVQPGGETEMIFEPANCARVLKLTATFKAGGGCEEQPSKVLTYNIADGKDCVSMLFAEDSGHDAKDIDYNDVTAKVHQFIE